MTFPNAYGEECLEELQNLRETLTGKEIAEKFGVSTATVNNRLRAMGLTTPRGGGKKAKK